MTTATEITIRRLDESNPTALYHRYPRENQPQPVYVSLDLETGVLEADWNSSIGGRGTSERNFNGVERRWSVPCLRASAMNDLLDEIAPLAARVLAGAEVEWTNGRYRGRLVTEDAREAEGEIERFCQDQHDNLEGQVNVWDAADYYAGLGGYEAQAEALGITAETTDEELAAITAREEEEGPDGTDIDAVEGVADHLYYLRERLQEARIEAQEYEQEMERLAEED